MEINQQKSIRPKMKGYKLVRSSKHNSITIQTGLVVYAFLHYTRHSNKGNNTILNMMDKKLEPILANACTYFMQSKLEFCALVLFIYDWPHTTYKSSR
jgi:hypothetical protein